MAPDNGFRQGRRINSKMILGPNAAYAENETSEQSSTRNDRPQAYSFIVVSMYLCQL